MTRYATLIAFGAILIAGAIQMSVSQATTEASPALRAVSTSLNQFAHSFYKVISAEQPNNLICSPLSLSMALSMAYFGARTESATELRTGLHLPANDAFTKNGFESLIVTLNNVKKVQLKIANKIFTQSGLRVHQAFIDVTRNSFKSPSQNVNFLNREAASATINAWASEQTNGLIKDLIKPDDLKGVMMVLTNAVYFKGQWRLKFEQSLTRPRPFHVNGARTTENVPTMYKLAKYIYGTLPALDAHYVEIPYQYDDEKDATSMFIILPNAVDGLRKAENGLDTVNFQQLHNSGRITEIHLYMPKFKIQNDLKLVPTLKTMGMRRVFSDFADFRGITDDPPLKIGDVIQKAVIEVNEEGSEAAAVTAVIGAEITSVGHVPPPPITMRIDRPFVYAIVHKSTDTVLFQGHITKPV